MNSRGYLWTLAKGLEGLGLLVAVVVVVAGPVVCERFALNGIAGRRQVDANSACVCVAIFELG